MQRERRVPRPDLIEKVERLGLTFHTLAGQPYWNESAAYRFESAEISVLERATNDLHALCLAASEHVIRTQRFNDLGIPEVAHEAICKAWDEDPPAVYGRFDLVYDGHHPPKMLEYNADTPTSLLEAAVIQWHWLQEMEPGADQFNSIWEGLVEKWSSLQHEGYLNSNWVHFGCLDAMEDIMTTAVLMDTAREAGLQVELLHMNQIGWDKDRRCFVNRDHQEIQTLFKLYPWEWILRDKFGTMALESLGLLQWIEPIWKMVLSNKAILAILWELFPGHPNLLPAYFESPQGLKNFVKKPFLGREGANISIMQDGQEVVTAGDYPEGPFIYQEYAPLPEFEGNHAVIGSWVVDGVARGMGIRESNGPITQDHARFVPHYFR